MSVLVNEQTVALIQGITGKQGQIHSKRMLESGAKVAAGVAPGKGGQTVNGIPVYNTVAEAVQAHPEINATMILVPKQFVLSAAMDAVACGIALIVLITEFVPVKDALQIVTAAKEKGLQVIGPNTIGVISPGRSKVGVMPDYIYSRGHIAIISRSGTLTHETASNLTFRGYGQSTCVGVGGDPIIGATHAEVLELLADDDDTLMIVIIGEIGGVGEEMAAEKIKELKIKKPIAAFIAGASAPDGKKMGHAGAIVTGNMGTAKSKIEALSAAGVKVCPTLGKLVDYVAEVDRELGGKLKTVAPKVK